MAIPRVEREKILEAIQEFDSALAPTDYRLMLNQVMPGTYYSRTYTRKILNFQF